MRCTTESRSQRAGRANGYCLIDHWTCLSIHGSDRIGSDRNQIRSDRIGGVCPPTLPVYAPTHLATHPTLRIHPHIHPPTHVPTHPITHPLMHPPTHAPARPPSHLPTQGCASRVFDMLTPLHRLWRIILSTTCLICSAKMSSSRSTWRSVLPSPQVKT